MLSHFSCVQLSVTLWTIACKTPLFMGFSRQKCWSGLSCPPPGDLPNPGIEPESLMSPTLAGGFFTTNSTWDTLNNTTINILKCISVFLEDLFPEVRLLAQPFKTVGNA